MDRILAKLDPSVKQCKLAHMPESNQAKKLAQIVQHLPASASFRMPDTLLASSTPGPRVDKVKDIFTSHTVSDSLRIINHLLLSDDDCRFVRSISLVGLSSEYAVKKLRRHLLGNDGNGWVVSEKKSWKKWFRKPSAEISNIKNGKCARKEVVIGKIPKSDIITAVEHWAELLTNQGQ